MTVEGTFFPGKGHDFHRHPGQEEVIYVLEGTIEQWVESESRTLTAGDAVVIPAENGTALSSVGSHSAP